MISTLRSPSSLWIKFGLSLSFALLVIPSFAADKTTGELSAIDRELIKKFDAIPNRAVPNAGTYEYERFHFHWRPVLLQDLTSGRLLIDLSVIKTHILPELKKKKIEVDALSIAADGGAGLGGSDIKVGIEALNVNHPYFLYDGGASHLMHYARIALLSHVKPVHVTDNGYVEKFEFPRLDSRNYAKFAEVEMKLPPEFRGDAKIDTSVVKLAGDLQHANVVWSIAPDSKNKELREAYLKYGFQLQPEQAERSSDSKSDWEIQLPLPDAKKLRVARADILTKGGAAFNQHSYFWDDHYVAEARASSDPKVALDTATYWLMSQQADGAIGRELDYKGQPFQAAQFIKFGVTEPNRDYFNPLIMGWAWHEIYNWNPEGAAPYLPKVISTMEKQREWMRNNHAIFDDAKNLVGFMWSNEGSGRDNAPRPIDETGMDALPLYGEKHQIAKGRDRRGLAVDLLAQYKSLIDHEIEFLKILGKFDDVTRLEIESKEIKETLNRRYFNGNLGWYVDLVPTGANAWEQTKDVTFAGFWPVASKACDREQVVAMVKKYLENEHEFKSEFLPSISKSNPYYDEGGHYWKGGGWPPDWEMAARALKEMGIRSEAAILTERNMRAISVASDGWKAGDTPEFLIKWTHILPAPGSEASYNASHAKIDEYFQKFWNGEIKNPAPTDPRGNIFEFYGLRRSPQTGAPVATYGQEVINDDSTIHLTRSGFAGWGAVVPLRSAHSIFGLDAVPKFQGKDADFDKWLYSLLTDAEFKYHFVSKLPAFRRIAKGFWDPKPIEFTDFKKVLNQERKSSSGLRAQLKLLHDGYLEFSPTFDPTAGGAEIKNFNWQGISFSIAMARDEKGRVHVNVRSAKPLRIQINKLWTASGKASVALDDAEQATPILVLGGNSTSLKLDDQW